MTDTNATQTQETNSVTVSDELKAAIANGDRDTIAEALDKGELSYGEYERLSNSSTAETVKEEAQADTATETETEVEAETSTETDKTEEATPELSEKEKLEKQVRDKEAMIQRQALEVGELRRKAREAEEKLAATTKPEMTDEKWSKFNENPDAYIQTKVTEELKARETAQDTFKRLEAEFFDKFKAQTAADFKEVFPQMVEVLKEDGIAEENIAAFEAEPYAYSLDALVQLAKRVNDRKKFSTSITEKETKAKEISDKTNSRKPAITSKATSATGEGVFAAIASAHKTGGRDALADLIERGDATTAEVREWLNTHGS